MSLRSNSPHPEPVEGRGRSRRGLIFGAGATALAASGAWADEPPLLIDPALPPAPSAAQQLASIEKKTGGRLGVFAHDLKSGRTLAHRADERFPMCSTFKMVLAAYVLARVDAGRERLDRRISYTAADLLDYAPTAKAHLAQGAMSLGDLCIAAVQLSDNTAANLILKEIGGPAALTAWLRHIGDLTTRLDRNEPSLNVWSPGEVHDTTSPAAIVATWRKLLLGDVLSPTSRAHLTTWIKGTTTGKDRLHAGLPANWVEGDKTGTWGGPPGTANDIAILWPPAGGPILVAAFLAQATVPGPKRDAALANVASVIVSQFAAHG